MAPGDVFAVTSIDVDTDEVVVAETPLADTVLTDPRPTDTVLADPVRTDSVFTDAESEQRHDPA